MVDNLSKAADCKAKAKTAIKNKDFDLAWQYLNEQKGHYLKQASDWQWDALSTLVADSSVHLDMANVSRLENKHLEALKHISYTYATNHAAKRPLKTLEEKLGAYFKRSKIESVSLQGLIDKLKSLKGDPQLTSVAGLIGKLK